MRGNAPVRAGAGEDDRAAQVAGVVGVHVGLAGLGQAQPVHPHEVGHRVDVAVLEVGTGGPTWSASPSGTSPNAHVARPGAAMLIGPCRYSMAG